MTEDESLTSEDRQRLTGLRSIQTAQTRITELENAIRTHRSQKADDRCILDDDTLYAVLGDGIACDRRVGNQSAMLKNCERFIANRTLPGGWMTYAELERALLNYGNHADDCNHGLKRGICDCGWNDLKAKLSTAMPELRKCPNCDSPNGRIAGVSGWVFDCGSTLQFDGILDTTTRCRERCHLAKDDR